MGAGKSTIGKAVASHLGWPYFDNDFEMAQMNRVTLEDLGRLPVDELHEMEENYLRNVIARPTPYIAGAAASVVDNPDVVDLLKGVYAIYLTVPLSGLLARAGAGGVGRQALAEHPEEIIKQRFERRDPLYREAASLVIDQSQSPEKSIKQVIEALSQ